LTGRLLACAALLLSLALPAGAAAKPGYFAVPAYRSAELSMHGSNGYLIRIYRQQPGSLSVLASKGKRTVNYFIPHVGGSTERIRARLPGVGRLALHFHRRSTSRRRERWPGCTGGARSIQKGVFTGTIRLHGERSYTAVSLHRAGGEVVSVEREVCKRSDGGHERSSDATFLAAGSRTPAGLLDLFSFEFPGLPDGAAFVSFNAALDHHRGRMQIQNGVSAFSEDPADFRVEGGRHPSSATITPPAPFTGSATFSRQPDGSIAWSGDLEVELPGVGPVVLTGPGFEPQLCVGDSCEGHSKTVGIATRPQLSRLRFFDRGDEGGELGLRQRRFDRREQLALLEPDVVVEKLAERAQLLDRALRRH
jgi:hypothetical protein